MIEETEGQETEGALVPAAEYYMDVLKETISLLESAIRLAVAQGEWEVAEGAIEARSGIVYRLRWIEEKGKAETDETT